MKILTARIGDAPVFMTSPSLSQTKIRSPDMNILMNSLVAICATGCKIHPRMFIRLVSVIFLFSLLSAPADAEDLPFDTSEYSDALKLADETFASGVIKTIGLLSLNRPYQGAATLGSSSNLELGIEITFVKLPDDFGAALAVAGAPALKTPAIPIPRIQIEKGMGESVNIGASYVGYKVFKIYGADIQYAFLRPEEHPYWAFRLSYSMARIAYVTTQTFSPQLLVSRPMDFADPYLGLGLAFISGSLFIDVPELGQSIGVEGAANSAFSFLGVKLRVPGLGLKIALEGSYSISGAHTMGLATGLAF